MSFATFLRKIVEHLDRSGIPDMATGGVALLAHGEPRFTADADIVITPVAETLEVFLRGREPDWYVSSEAAHDALRDRGMFNVVETTTGWKADLIVMRDEPFDSAAFSRRRAISALGISFYGVSPEDLVLSKLRRAAETHSEKQIQDAFGVLAVQGGALDEEYMRRFAQELGVGDTLENLLQDSRRSR